MSQCPHHRIETWRLCQIIYEGLDPNSKTILESMCQDQFINKESIKAWQLTISGGSHSKEPTMGDY